MVGTETGNWKDLIKLNSNERRKEWKKISSSDGEADEEYFWYGGLEDEETIQIVCHTDLFLILFKTQPKV